MGYCSASRPLGDYEKGAEGTYVQERYTTVIEQSRPWGIGWLEEVPGVNCQEASKEEWLESLRVTLREALEYNRREAIEATGESYEEEPSTYEVARVVTVSAHAWLRAATGRRARLGVARSTSEQVVCRSKTQCN